jgi:hypothetical protein
MSWKMSTRSQYSSTHEEFLVANTNISGGRQSLHHSFRNESTGGDALYIMSSCKLASDMDKTSVRSQNDALRESMFCWKTTNCARFPCASPESEVVSPFALSARKLLLPKFQYMVELSTKAFLIEKEIIAGQGLILSSGWRVCVS